MKGILRFYPIGSGAPYLYQESPPLGWAQTWQPQPAPNTQNLLCSQVLGKGSEQSTNWVAHYDNWLTAKGDTNHLHIYEWSTGITIPFKLLICQDGASYWYYINSDTKCRLVKFSNCHSFCSFWNSFQPHSAQRERFQKDVALSEVHKLHKC